MTVYIYTKPYGWKSNRLARFRHWFMGSLFNIYNMDLYWDARAESRAFKPICQRLKFPVKYAHFSPPSTAHPSLILVCVSHGTIYLISFIEILHILEKNLKIVVSVRPAVLPTPLSSDEQRSKRALSICPWIRHDDAISPSLYMRAQTRITPFAGRPLG